MWICSNQGFVSIVEHKTDPTCLVVRARRADHLAALLGHKVKIHESTNTDYRYRCYCSRSQVARAVASRIEGISYPNFKSSVTDRFLHRLYNRVWSIMLELQNGVGLYGRRYWDDVAELDDDQGELLERPKKAKKGKAPENVEYIKVFDRERDPWCDVCDSPAEWAADCRSSDCPCRR